MQKFFYDYIGKISIKKYEVDNSLTNNLFIVGGGGHALSVLEILKEKSMAISGYIDVTPSSKLICLTLKKINSCLSSNTQKINQKFS